MGTRTELANYIRPIPVSNTYNRPAAPGRVIAARQAYGAAIANSQHQSMPSSDAAMVSLSSGVTPVTEDNKDGDSPQSNQQEEHVHRELLELRSRPEEETKSPDVSELAKIKALAAKYVAMYQTNTGKALTAEQRVTKEQEVFRFYSNPNFPERKSRLEALVTAE